MSVDLLKPIPCLDSVRALKSNYRDYHIDREDYRFSEPLVPVTDFNLPGVAYYSRPNSATIEPVEGVSPNIFVRRSVAEKAAASNEFLLAHDGLAKLFGGRIGLSLQEGFRPPVLQKYLYDECIPRLIRSQNPTWAEQEVAERRSQVIAKPDWSEVSMPPHFTGGAIDVILIAADSGEILNTGFRSGGVGQEAIHTDYLELLKPAELVAHGLEIALLTRRILYNVLTAQEIGGVSMVSNPTETWHYSLYDQMWAQFGSHPAALYGIPPEIPDELLLVA